jgi:UDP-N-acetylglucosamine--N-acetylmuramyl-(pentapeptide) pyrophosphoryl-undecaprenol N-acetylglucosamine transferase
MDDEGNPRASSPEGEKISSSYTRNLSRNRQSEREIRRLRNSVSFQLGLHLTSSIRRPWKLFFLPFSFPLLAFSLGLRKIGRKPAGNENSIIKSDVSSRRHSIVLFPTNGVGFGHFTRMYAVARALRKHDPTLEIIFFTPMPTLHILYNEQFPTYHLAGRYKHEDMTATQWNGLVEDMLHLIFEAHKPKWFMFDGAYPYRGMLNAIASQPTMKKWWMRRGSMKARTSLPVDSFDFFDGFVIPGEETKAANEREHVVAPIRVFEANEVWERSYARSRIAVPGNCKVVYVQLGAGRINNIEGLLDNVLEALFTHEEVFVVLGESMLGERLSFQHERLRIIRDYPNSLYIRGFDAAVQAGGYNSYQEMRTFGIPTLFIPNMDTGMDDQLLRCRQAEEEGWGRVLTTTEPQNLQTEIASLLDTKRKKGFTESGNGADETATLLLSLSDLEVST